MSGDTTKGAYTYNNEYAVQAFKSENAGAENLSRYFSLPEETASITGFNQQNHFPELGGNYFPSFQLGIGPMCPRLDAATPLVLPPATIVVLSTPAMYTVDNKPTAMSIILKDLFESHAKTVSGIDLTYANNATEAGPTGHDGQQFKVPTKTTRAPVDPSFAFQELSGNLVWNTFKKWIWDINHPDTYVSMAQLQYPGAWCMSVYSMTIMVLQFNVTGRPESLLDASVITNIFPTTTTEFGMQRTIGTMEAKERTITFSGIIQHNDYTKALGMYVADQLQLHTINYNVAPPTRSFITPELNGTGIDAAKSERRVWGSSDIPESKDQWTNEGILRYASKRHNLYPQKTAYTTEPPYVTWYMNSTYEK